jgi:transglutaminase-like putative cysteine protease
MTASTLILLIAASGATAHDSPTATRKFRFTYSATIEGLEPGTAARVWLPVAPTNDDQEVEIVAINLPGEYQRNTEPNFNNDVLYFEAPADEAGKIPLSIDYRVTRMATTPAGTPADAGANRQFLGGSSLVPVDGTVAKRLFGVRPPKGTARQIARTIYERVDEHMRYDKTGEGWGRGDALWACDSRRGNCSDFHSLFISLARSEKIPSKFVMGFAIPPLRGSGEVGGYHCWGWFLPEGKGWVPVDISEANQHPDMQEYFFGNLTENRVQFTTGRDLALVPRQSGGLLNFFIYPYVEVDGQPYPAEKVARRFAYQDVPASGK